MVHSCFRICEYGSTKKALNVFDTKRLLLHLISTNDDEAPALSTIEQYLLKSKGPTVKLGCLFITAGSVCSVENVHMLVFTDYCFPEL